MTVSRRAWIVPDNPYVFPSSLAVRCGCRAWLDDVQDVHVSWRTGMCGNDGIYSVSCIKTSGPDMFSNRECRLLYRNDRESR